MEELLNLSAKLIAKSPKDFRRYLYSQINWNNRLIGIKGARGTGKSTMLLQWLQQRNLPQKEAAYFSLDELYFTYNSLFDLARDFYNRGGKVLVLDEVHKYSDWSRTIKNLYDRYDDLQIVFTGSSIIEITRQEADLSRRMLMYELKGMSFREYMLFEHRLNLPTITLEQLRTEPESTRTIFPPTFKPYAYFQDYLRYGYYPFFQNDKDGYHQRLGQLIRTIVEYDMAEIKGFDIRHAKKMLQLLYVVAQQVPFKPNIQSLADKTGIHRNSINNYLYFLHEARLIHLLYPEGISVATLQKPEKIFLENTNLLFTLSENIPSLGTVREVFFNNQLSVLHKVHQAATTDFVVDNQYYFEIGGKRKTSKQIKDLDNAWIVKDELEYPVSNSLPLWLFGFLY